MDSLNRFAQAYRTLDPAAWVGAFRLLPVWAAALAIAVGVLLLLLGGGRVFRVLAGPLGVLVGAVGVPMVTAKLGATVDPRWVGLAAASVLALAGFIYPPAVSFVGVGVTAGLLGGRLATEDSWVVVFFAAFLAAGAVGLALHRFLAAIVSSLVGGWLLTLGVLAAVKPLGSFSESVARQPWGVVAAAGLFAVAGAVYQLTLRPSPEQREERRTEKARTDKRAAEKRALEERWGKFDPHDGDE